MTGVYVTIPNKWRYLFGVENDEEALQYDYDKDADYQYEVPSDTLDLYDVFVAYSVSDKLSYIKTLNQSADNLSFIYYTFTHDGVDQELVDTTKIYFEYLYSLDNGFDEGTSLIAMSHYMFCMIYMDSTMSDAKKDIESFIAYYSDEDNGYEALNIRMTEMNETITANIVAYSELLNSWNTDNAEITEALATYNAYIENSASVSVYLDDDTADTAYSLREQQLAVTEEEYNNMIDMVTESTATTEALLNDTETASNATVDAATNEINQTSYDIENESSIIDEITNTKTAYLTSQLNELDTSVVQNPMYEVSLIDTDMVENSFSNYTPEPAEVTITETVYNIIVIVASVISSVVALFVIVYIILDAIVIKSVGISGTK